MDRRDGCVLARNARVWQMALVVGSREATWRCHGWWCLSLEQGNSRRNRPGVRGGDEWMALCVTCGVSHGHGRQQPHVGLGLRRRSD